MGNKKAIFSDVETVEVRETRVTWSGMGDDDVGDYVNLPIQPDKTVHVFGTWDNATLVIQGSNEEGIPTAPVTLTDPQGNAISKTVNNFVEVILENTAQIRPKTSGGQGATDLTVIIVAKGESSR